MKLTGTEKEIQSQEQNDQKIGFVAALQRTTAGLKQDIKLVNIWTLSLDKTGMEREGCDFKEVNEDDNMKSAHYSHGGGGGVGGEKG